MLDSGSAFGDDTLTIWKSTLDNPESGGRKYPAAHLSKNMAILSFFDSGHFEVISRRDTPIAGDFSIAGDFYDESPNPPL